MSDSESLSETEQKSNATRILVYGEVLYDCFPDGRQILGGAPFNVAYGLNGFGHQPYFMSAVGDDAEGKAIRLKMSDWGMLTEGLQLDSAHPTGKVKVTFNGDEPQYEICEDRAWDHIQDVSIPDVEMIYHGSLVLRDATSRSTFESLVNRTDAKRFFDVNLRAPYYSRELLERWVQGADWVKLNIDELAYLAGVEAIDFKSAEGKVDILRERYDVANVLLTAGGEGALIKGVYGYGRIHPAPTPEVFVDTVGAGDSFTAVTIGGILANQPTEQIVREAAHFASRVCGLHGATAEDKSFYTIKP